jgi:TATA-binding protein-associated factor Taf7
LPEDYFDDDEDDDEYYEEEEDNHHESNGQSMTLTGFFNKLKQTFDDSGKKTKKQQSALRA